MARSATVCAICGATTLMAAIRSLATLLPWRSIMSAAFSVSRRACSISQNERATSWRMLPCSANLRPKATRVSTRRHIDSSARWAWPMERMQWWMRPGPSRPWAISKPLPGPQDEVGLGHAQAVEAQLGLAAGRVHAAEHLLVAHDGQAGRVARHDDGGMLLVARIARQLLAHHQQQGATRVHDAADPPLAAGDDEFVAVFLDAGLDVGGV